MWRSGFVWRTLCEGCVALARVAVRAAAGFTAPHLRGGEGEAVDNG
jgi:hypothetical protein